MSLSVTRVPAGELPVNVNDTRSPLWTGMWLLLIIEAVVFAGLITSYFYLRLFAPEWPIGGISRPDLGLPTISALLLFASSAPIYWADSSMKKGKVTRMKIGMVLGFLLGGAFLVLKGVEYSGYDYTWATNAYGSIVWTISGFHAAHVFSVMLKVVVVLAAAFRGYFSEERNMGVRINGLYWHFVVVVWIPLFFTLYLSHYVL